MRGESLERALEIVARRRDASEFIARDVDNYMRDLRCSDCGTVFVAGPRQRHCPACFGARVSALAMCGD